MMSDRKGPALDESVETAFAPVSLAPPELTAMIVPAEVIQACESELVPATVSLISTL